MTSRMKRRLRIDLAYDGTDFAGWQIQPRSRTVQGVVEAELARLQGGRSVALRAAGRTDAGVHALGQVSDCEIECRLADQDLCHALGTMLPPDVRPLAVRTAAPGFHARRDALAKTYEYRLDLSRPGDPFRARYALHVPYELDEVRLREALDPLPGRHDWSGFTASGCATRDRVRRLTAARFERLGDDEGRFTFTAEGFLYHMVRNLVGTLLDIGSGRMEASRVQAILASGDRAQAGPTAPARGLCLVHVAYPGE